LKKSFLLIIILLPLFCFSQETIEKTENVVTTYYLIRHAEKDRSDKTNKNPELTRKGQFRAENWAQVFEKVDLDAIYSTNYNRTLMTASPTSMQKDIQISLYDPRALFSEEFKTNTKGKIVLIVGHSNTTPAFVNAIIDEKTYPDMNHHNNSSLYIVTIVGATKEVQVLSIN